MTDSEQQQALVHAIKADLEMLFKASEHAYGKPCQALNVNQGEFRMIQ